MNTINRSEWLGWNNLPIPKEGNTGKYEKYQNFLFHFLKELNPKNMLEIGFNAGHSSCCFLNACPTAKMYTFDICRHGTEEIAVNELKKYFNIQLIPGDSTKTVPEFLSKNPLQFDFIFIDGGHLEEIAYQDIMNTKEHLVKNGFMLIDDLGVGTVNQCIIKSNIMNECDPYILNNIEKNVLLLYNNPDPQSDFHKPPQVLKKLIKF